MIIHQIWIGDNEPPLLWMDTVRDFCTKYKYSYFLWRDTDVSNFPLINRPLFDELRKKQMFSGAIDVFRYELLYKYGGVYIDADMVVLNPNGFHRFLQVHDHTVFMGKEPVTPVSPDLYANSVLGAPPESLFYRDLVAGLPAHAAAHADKDAWIMTGPTYLTVFAKTRTDYTLIQSTVFYPMAWHNIKDPHLHTKITLPKESLLFQYGYTTNNFKEILARREERRSNPSASCLPSLSYLWFRARVAANP